MATKSSSCVEGLQDKGYSEKVAQSMCTEKDTKDSNPKNFCGKETKEGVFLSFDSFPIRATIDEMTGFLTAPAFVSRIGVQEYFGYELGVDGEDAQKKFGVFRPAEEVFCEDSIKSFLNLVVTEGHPKGIVNVGNVRLLQKGQLNGVDVVDETGLRGVVSITDGKLIEDIRRGKKELSVGYTNYLDETTGVYKGQPYHFIQRQIRANHLAVVDSGRCGPECQIILDEKGNETMVKLKIGEKEYDVPEEVKAAFEKMQKALEAKAADAEEEEEEKKKPAKDVEEEKKKSEDAIAKLQATVDAKQAELDAVLQQTTDESLSARIAEGIKVMMTVDRVLGDGHGLDIAKDGLEGIKRHVVQKVYDQFELDGKSESYVQGLFDSAVHLIERSKNEKGFRLVADGILKGSKAVSTLDEQREEVRKSYEEKFLNIKK